MGFKSPLYRFDLWGHSLCLGWLVMGIAGCSSNADSSTKIPSAGMRLEAFREKPVIEDRAWFSDVTEQVGVIFKHENGATGNLLLPEIMGSGAALADFDGDGDLDLLLVQGGPLIDPGKSDVRPAHRLFRNDLDKGTGLRFTDMTESSGIKSLAYGMGVATGDIDNDGLVDLFITALGSNQLLKNLGGGRFQDLTSVAGVGDTSYSSSATFFDFDHDGLLDLFVANYVDFDPARSPKCYAPNSAVDYCGPDAYKPLPDRLYRNMGQGRFMDISESAGLLSAFGAGLGVIAADFNQDGWVDLYVANDGDPNQLWINQAGKGVFIDEGLLAGVALNLRGQPEAGMGIDSADLDGDGLEEIFVTNLTGESNTLYYNLGGGLFEDRTSSKGMRAPSLPFTGFGTHFVDFDLDGDLDLFCLNGAVRIQDSRLAAGDQSPLGQTNQLFRNEGVKRFRDVSPRSGPEWSTSGVCRGGCVGDIDNDGDLDLLITENNGFAKVLLCHASSQAHWLGLRLIDDKSGCDVTQARVKISREGTAPQWRRVHTDGSYLSASDPRLIIGLGSDSSPRHVTAYWPDGLVEDWTQVEADRYHTLRRSTGRTIPPVKTAGIPRP